MQDTRSDKHRLTGFKANEMEHVKGEKTAVKRVGSGEGCRRFQQPVTGIVSFKSNLLMAVVKVPQ